MKKFLFKLLKKLYKPKIALAHCDIPCGIYTIEPAITASKTVTKMTEMLQNLTHPDKNNEKEMLEFLSSVSRFTETKEKHAQKCKDELLILWTDFFKEEHLQIFPNLHNIFWKTTKLCSKVKREINLKTAKDLEKNVLEIEKIFKKSLKNAQNDIKKTKIIKF